MVEVSLASVVSKFCAKLFPTSKQKSKALLVAKNFESPRCTYLSNLWPEEITRNHENQIRHSNLKSLPITTHFNFSSCHLEQANLLCPCKKDSELQAFLNPLVPHCHSNQGLFNTGLFFNTYHKSKQNYNNLLCSISFITTAQSDNVF